jgi:hypothetical protein
MLNEHWRRGYVGLLLVCSAACTTPTFITTPQQSRAEIQNMQHAKGTFEVKVTPQENKTGEPELSHMLLEKQFQGDLTGTSRGQMLAANTPIEGSAGYVAIERIAGTLQGRSGSFVVQHLGHMGRGQMQLTLTVLPDSGTEQLQGLSGAMRIRIEQGQHFYELDYTFAEQ